MKEKTRTEISLRSLGATIAKFFSLPVNTAMQQKTKAPNWGGSYNVRVIDECEYLEYDYGILDHRVYAFTHKGNCKNPIHRKMN